MKILNLKQAAELLLMHPETLRRMAKKGDVPCVRKGEGAKQPRYRFIQEKLVEWMSQDLPFVDLTDGKVRRGI